MSKKNFKFNAKCNLIKQSHNLNLEQKQKALSLDLPYEQSIKKYTAPNLDSLNRKKQTLF